MAAVDQGGLGLPDRDQYLKDDARSVELRQKYQKHVASTFALLGETPDQAAASAAAVMEVETGLARVSMERVKRRDPQNRYNKRTREECRSWCPPLPSRASSRPPAPRPSTVSTSPRCPSSRASRPSSRATTWAGSRPTCAGRSPAPPPRCSRSLRRREFQLLRQTLTGAKEIRPRWKRCADEVDGALGEALGATTSSALSAAESKARTNAWWPGSRRRLRRTSTSCPG